MRTRSILVALSLIMAGSAFARDAKDQHIDIKPIFYADVADMVGTAPIVAVATIDKVERLRGDLAVDVPPGHARFLISAAVTLLLHGDQGLPARIQYLIDVPLDAANRPPKLRKRKVLIAAAPVAGKPASIRLVAPRAQMDWSQGLETQARAILNETVAPDAPPHILGVGNAFHVRGSLPGESETQIFLKTINGDPVSLSILRRPGEETRWAVALGEMVDDAATPPTRDTLLWYRLACFLPPALPQESIANLSEDDAVAANLDYQFVITALGPCQRDTAP